MQTCPWKVFKNLQNETCVKIALDICQILGASEAVEMVADSLMEQLRESEHKKEILLLLNELLSSKPFIKPLYTVNPSYMVPS